MSEIAPAMLNCINRLLRKWRSSRQSRAADWVIGVTAPDHQYASSAPFVLDEFTRRGHVSIVGGSGSGKSTLLNLIVRHHVIHQCGVVVIDPHGDLTLDLVRYLTASRTQRMPFATPERLQRIFLIEPFRESTICLNPLAGDGPIHLRVSEIVGVFRRTWSEGWGFRMEDIIRHSLLALAMAADGYGLPDVPAFLVDDVFRRKVLGRVSDPRVREYWAQRYDRLPVSTRLHMVEAVLNKFSQLLSHPGITTLLDGRAPALNVRRLMDEQAVILVNCSRGELKDSSAVLGSLFVAAIQSAALSRANVDAALRKPVALIVDEAQSFAPEDCETFLNEARKYGVFTYLAQQHLGQLRPVHAAIFANASTKITFAASAHDSAILAAEMGSDTALAHRIQQLRVGEAVIHQRAKAPVRVRIMPVTTPNVCDVAFNAMRTQLARGIEDRDRGRQTAPACPPDTPSTTLAPQEQELPHGLASGWVEASDD